ncbi:uncharacterized protein [Watersipora subatra]|uniref:uncharacterized protein n=1 Tax=Watersipora subatra TaxID=2589382 RepID=UPI00355B14B1
MEQYAEVKAQTEEMGFLEGQAKIAGNGGTDEDDEMCDAVSLTQEDIPFSQQFYSQPPPSQPLSAAQSFLDDLLSSDIDGETRRAPPALIGCCNGKMFASPPRPLSMHLRPAIQHCRTTERQVQLNESCASNPMDATGVFEPSQRDGRLALSDSASTVDALSDTMNEDPFFLNIQKAKTSCPATNIHLTNKCEIENRQFVLSTTTKIDVLSNSELTSSSCTAWYSLPQSALDCIDSWD